MSFLQRQASVTSAALESGRRHHSRPDSQCLSEPKEDGQPLLNQEDAPQSPAEEDVNSPTTPKRPALSPITENRVLSKSRAGSHYNPDKNDRSSVVHPTRTRKHTLTSMTSDAFGVGSRHNLSNQLSRISVRSYAQSLSRLSQSQMITAGESMASIALSGVDPKEFTRPFSRKDIFLQGSIKNLPEYEAEGKYYFLAKKLGIGI